MKINTTQKHCADEGPKNNQRYRKKVGKYETNIKSNEKWSSLSFTEFPKGGGQRPPVKGKERPYFHFV